MARQVVRTEGFAELNDALQELSSSATQNNVKKRALLAGAEPIAEKARQLVPVDKGDLRAAIEVNTVQPKPKRQKSYYGVTVWLRNTGAYRALKNSVKYAGRRGQRGESRSYAYGSAPEVRGRFTEFGTSREPAQPFFRPAWAQEGGESALKRIADALRIEIGKAVERARRKALRQKGK